MHVRLQFLSLLLALIVVDRACRANQRAWTDVSGKFKLEAEFVVEEEGVVQLRTPDGKSLRIPREKLSLADQQLVAELAAAAADPRNVGKAIGERAKKFFAHLRSPDRQPIKAMLSQAAQATWAAGNSPVNDLPTPDGRRGIALVGVQVKAEQAIAKVRVKIDGQRYLTELHFEKEKHQWQIASLVAHQPDGSEKTIHFAVANANGGRPGDATGSPADSLGATRSIEVPSGTPEELLAFIESTRAAGAPAGISKAAHQQRVREAVVKASDKMFAADLTPNLVVAAVQHKLWLIREQAKSSPQDATVAVESLAQRVAEYKNHAANHAIETLDLRMAVDRADSAAKMKPLMQRILQLLRSAQVGPWQVDLAYAAGQQARKVSAPGVGDYLEQAGELAATCVDPRFARTGRSMLASGRQLNLLGNEMPLSGVGIDGSPVDLGHTEGKVVLVQFWATWCPACVAEIDNMVANYRAYHDRGFEVVAVSLDDSPVALEQFVERRQLPWTIIADRHPSRRGETTLAEYYGVNATPTTMLINRAGKVVSFACHGRQLEQLLKRYL